MVAVDVYTLTSFGLRRAGDIPPMDDEAWRSRERAREIARVVKGLEEEPELLPKAEEPEGPPANPVQDLVMILLRLEEGMERVERKLDAYYGKRDVVG